MQLKEDRLILIVIFGTNHVSWLVPLQSMSPGSSKETTDKPKKSSKKSSRSVWTVPTEKLWKRGSSSTTLPLYNPPPSTPIKGTSISKLKEMNGWKWRREKTTFRPNTSWRTGRGMVSDERAIGASSSSCLLKSDKLMRLANQQKDDHQVRAPFYFEKAGW